MFGQIKVDIPLPSQNGLTTPLMTRIDEFTRECCSKAFWINKLFCLKDNAVLDFELIANI